MFSVTSLLLAAIGTQDVATVGEEAATEECRMTLVARETIGVPVAVFEGNKLCTIDSCTSQNHTRIDSDWRFHGFD